MIGDQGEYEIPVGGTSSNVYKDNLLVGNIKATTVQSTETIDGNEYLNYYLSMGDRGVDFYKVNGSVTLAANRAYLRLPSDISLTDITYEDSSDFDDSLENIVEIGGIYYYLAKEDKTATVINLFLR